MQNFLHTLKASNQMLRLVLLLVFFFFFGLIIFLNSSWPDEKKNSSWKKIVANLDFAKSSKIGLCDWDLVRILQIRNDLGVARDDLVGVNNGNSLTLWCQCFHLRLQPRALNKQIMCRLGYLLFHLIAFLSSACLVTSEASVALVDRV